MVKKILAFYTKYFAIWVVLCGIIAYLWPRPFVSMKGGMDWFFAATMFGIGAALEPEDFKRLLRSKMTVGLFKRALEILNPQNLYEILRLVQYSS